MSFWDRFKRKKGPSFSERESGPETPTPDQEKEAFEALLDWPNVQRLIPPPHTYPSETAYCPACHGRLVSAPPTISDPTGFNVYCPKCWGIPKLNKTKVRYCPHCEQFRILISRQALAGLTCIVCLKVLEEPEKSPPRSMKVGVDLGGLDRQAYTVVGNLDPIKPGTPAKTDEDPVAAYRAATREGSTMADFHPTPSEVESLPEDLSEILAHGNKFIEWPMPGGCESSGVPAKQEPVPVSPFSGDQMLADFYRHRLLGMKVNLNQGGTALERALWMCYQITEEYVKENKATRWVGFIQGILWSQHVYSIDELREHSRKFL